MTKRAEKAPQKVIGASSRRKWQIDREKLFPGVSPFRLKRILIMWKIDFRA